MTLSTIQSSSTMILISNLLLLLKMIRVVTHFKSHNFNHTLGQFQNLGTSMFKLEPLQRKVWKWSPIKRGIQTLRRVQVFLHVITLRISVHSEGTSLATDAKLEGILHVESPSSLSFVIWSLINCLPHIVYKRLWCSRRLFV